MRPHLCPRPFWLLALVPLLVAALLWPATTSAKSVSWDAYDVTIELRPDGVLHVTQRETIQFWGGPFSSGFIAIPTARTEGIENITVGEVIDGALVPYRQVTPDEFEYQNALDDYVFVGNDIEYRTGEAGIYTIRPLYGEVEISYRMGATSNQERIIEFSYDLVGALRVYPEGDPPNQQIWWEAIGPEVTSIGDVAKASVTIVLPEAVALEDVRLGEATGGPAEEHTSDGKTWRWEYSYLSYGDFVEVRMQVPMLANAEVPTWQPTDDARREAVESRERRTALTNLIFFGIATCLGTVGVVGLYAIWYTQGRDPQVGLVASFLAEPPDDLPAGLVGGLLDETVNEHDIIASVADFGRRGVVTIAPVTTATSFGNADDFKLTVVADDVAMRPYEELLLKTLFGKTPEVGDTVTLGAAKSRFNTAASGLREAMYADLISAGYFKRSPETIRSHWRTNSSTLIFFLVVAGGIAGLIWARSYGSYWLALVVAVGLAFALRALNRGMPRKTESGAMAAAKWRAFRTYLSDIDRYEKVKESQEIFQRYLAFAIAFGLEKAWVARFTYAGVAVPPWFGQGGDILGEPGRGPSSGGRRPVIVGTPGTPGGGPSMPSIPNMQDMSDSAGKTLQGSSDSLLTMLTLAAEVFGEVAGSGGGGGRSGGFGGGGRSRGAGGSGGRRGFS